MGCSPGDPECADSEKPPHPVTITKGFWLGQTEVTVGAYKRVMAGQGKELPDAPYFNSGWTNDQMPMVKISWEEAKAYCAGAGGRLPTEAEWEYAARAQSPGARYGPLERVAWYAANSLAGGTHPVGEKQPNGFGLFDMLGNAGEWVNDWFDENYYQHSPSQNPTGPPSGDMGVVRGGCWAFNPNLVRVSFRGSLFPSKRYDDVGFRCSREVE
jgi:formylglycine-generating enzyme required for sulfatase activity